MSTKKSSINSGQLQSIAQDILKEAAKQGADQAEVSIDANKGFSVSTHGGELETIEYHQDKVIEISVYFGKRTGSASVTDIRPDSIKSAISAACHIAKFTDEDEAAGLAEKSELAFNYPELEIFYPWDISVDKAIEMACECDRIASHADKRILSSEECRVSTAEIFDIYANSHGFLGSYFTTHHEISCILIAKEGDEMQRDYSYTLAVDPKDLQSVSSVAEKAVKRAVSRLGARQLKTTKAPVLFVAEEARGLIGLFAAAIQGGNIYRKSSFLVDQLDKQIFPSFIQIQQQPHLSRALGSAPYDDDGVATRSNLFIEDGILRSYAMGVYSARKLGLKTTGDAGGLHNLTISNGKKSFDELVKTMNRGFIVAELMGQGINLLTGDYSRGVGGYWVENGEIQYPVHEVTVAGNLKEMFANIAEIGNDVDKRGNMRTGSILISEMVIAGN